MFENIVAIIKSKKRINGYPLNVPFNPPQKYPEYPFNKDDIDSSNKVYTLVRELLFYLELDKGNYGREKWNPLKEIVHQGDNVVIKPNMVLHFNASGKDINSVITHGSIIRAVMDYVFIALRGRGNITIADAPQMNADFGKLIEVNGLKEVIKFYRSKIQNIDITVSAIDLREERTLYKHGIVWKRVKLAGDPKGYTIIDLGSESEFSNINCKNVYGADYNRNETRRVHVRGSHKYYISKTILDADVLISIPKMKVHRKSGVSLNLKNMVGIIGNKNYIPHFRIGSSKEKGDETTEYNVIKKIDRKLRDLLLGKIWQIGKYPYAVWFLVISKLRLLNENEIEKGNWYGNDTVWRGVLDLNKILFYLDKKRMSAEKKCRKYFSLIDGIIAGEGEGPLSSTPKYCGIIIGGMNPVCVDLVTTRLMGFDCYKIPLLRNALNIKKYSLYSEDISDIIIKSNISDLKSPFKTTMKHYQFEPPRGWKGHIEL